MKSTAIRATGRSPLRLMVLLALVLLPGFLSGQYIGSGRPWSAKQSADSMAAVNARAEADSMRLDSLREFLGDTIQVNAAAIDALPTLVEVQAEIGDSLAGIWTQQGANTTGIATNVTNITNLQSDMEDSLDNKVNLTGDETVAGVKTFSSFPITPGSAPTTDYQTANKKYVDDNIGGGGGGGVKAATLTFFEDGTGDFGFNAANAADTFNVAMAALNDSGGGSLLMKGDFEFKTQGYFYGDDCWVISEKGSTTITVSGSALIALRDTTTAGARQCGIENITFAGTDSSYGIYQGGANSDSLIIRHCKGHGFTHASATIFILDTLSAGIRVENSEFWNNEVVKHAGMEGIYKNCFFHHGDGATGLYINAENVLVEGCRLENAGSTTFLYLYEAGGTDLAYAQDFMVRNNIIIDLTGDSTITGIRITNASQIRSGVIIGNRIYAKNYYSGGRLGKGIYVIANYGISLEGNQIGGAIDAYYTNGSSMLITGGAVVRSVDALHNISTSGGGMVVGMSGVGLVDCTNGLHNAANTAALFYDGLIVSGVTNLEVNDGNGSITGGGGSDGAIP